MHRLRGKPLVLCKDDAIAIQVIYTHPVHAIASSCCRDVVALTAMSCQLTRKVQSSHLPHASPRRRKCSNQIKVWLPVGICIVFTDNHLIFCRDDAIACACFIYTRPLQLRRLLVYLGFIGSPHASPRRRKCSNHIKIWPPVGICIVSTQFVYKKSRSVFTERLFVSDPRSNLESFVSCSFVVFI